jgi:hypothetical protein
MTSLVRKLLALCIMIASLAWLVPVQADAAGLGQRCGGFAGIRCNPGLWCEGRTGACGGADRSGTCVRASSACRRDYRPVCGCNGRTYGNDCARRNARVTKKHDGRC